MSRARTLNRQAIRAAALEDAGYAERVRQLESEGLTTSDAQAAAEAEFIKARSQAIGERPSTNFKRRANSGLITPAPAKKHQAEAPTVLVEGDFVSFCGIRLLCNGAQHAAIIARALSDGLVRAEVTQAAALDHFLSKGPKFTMDGEDVIYHEGSWFINMARPGYNSAKNNAEGYPSKASAERAIERHRRCA